MYLMMETIPIGKLISPNGWRCIKWWNDCNYRSVNLEFTQSRDIIKWKIIQKDNAQRFSKFRNTKFETHVVVSHERHEEIQKRFDKVPYVWTKWKNIQINSLQKLKELLFGLMGTLFITLLTTLFTIVYRAG